MIPGDLLSAFPHRQFYTLEPGFVQETRHKYQGLFKDFPAPNLIFSRTILFLLILISTDYRKTGNAANTVHCEFYKIVILTELYLRSYDLLYKRNSRTFKHLDQKSAVFQGFQGLEKPVMNFKYFQALQGPVRTL